jgi:RNA polymerase sigma-70 factor (ECF subfamily)
MGLRRRPPTASTGRPGGAPEEGSGDDEALLRQAAGGELRAFELLVERKRARAYRLARHVVGQDEDAEDVVQLAFIRVWRSLGRYHPGSGFDPWLGRIVVNLAIDFRRRSRTRHRGLRVLASAPRPRLDAAQVPHGLREAEVRRVFDDLAAELPARQRAVFALREIEGLDTEEVARLCGVRASPVRNHLFQARRALKQALERRYPEYLPEREGKE